MRKVSNVTDEEVGSLAYEVYCKAVGGKSFNGDPLPTWAEMKKAAEHDGKKENIIVAWKKAARAVAALVEKKQPDLPVESSSLSDPAKIPPLPPNPGAPRPFYSLKRRTGCCGSRVVNLVKDSSYACPCGDTVVDIRTSKDVEVA